MDLQVKFCEFKGHCDLDVAVNCPGGDCTLKDDIFQERIDNNILQCNLMKGKKDPHCNIVHLRIPLLGTTRCYNDQGCLFGDAINGKFWEIFRNMSEADSATMNRIMEKYILKNTKWYDDKIKFMKARAEEIFNKAVLGCNNCAQTNCQLKRTSTGSGLFCPHWEYEQTKLKVVAA